MQKKKYKAAKRRSLGRKPFLKTDGKYLSREQAHDRGDLRRNRDFVSRGPNGG
jgi:hypothetical protein